MPNEIVLPNLTVNVKQLSILEQGMSAGITVILQSRGEGLISVAISGLPNGVSCNSESVPVIKTINSSECVGIGTLQLQSDASVELRPYEVFIRLWGSIVIPDDLGPEHLDIDELKNTRSTSVKRDEKTEQVNLSKKIKLMIVPRAKIECAPTRIELITGKRQNLSVTVTPTDGSRKEVFVQYEDMPPGVSCDRDFSLLSNQAIGDLTLLANEQTPLGNSVVNISAQGRWIDDSKFYCKSSFALEVISVLMAGERAISSKYTMLNGPRGVLGVSVGEAFPLPDEQGVCKQYEKGWIYWRYDIGAHAILYGEISEKWFATGKQNGVLGYPIADEALTSDKVGRCQDFEKGSIWWHPSYRAFEVHGEIYNKWSGLGVGNGRMGYPISDTKLLTASDQISYNDFEHGLIVLLPSGVLVISSLILNLSHVIQSGNIDDGMSLTDVSSSCEGDGCDVGGTFEGDSHAELITWISVKVDEKIIEDRFRIPKEDFSDGNIERRYEITPVHSTTTFSFRVDVEDYDDFSGNDYLGRFEKDFNSSTLWSLIEDPFCGVFEGWPLTDKGKDTSSINALKLYFSVSIG